MKSVRKIIKEMVEKYPNDMELGARVGISDGYTEKRKQSKTKRLECIMYKYECKAGIYESDTLVGLLWERFKHKL